MIEMRGWGRTGQGRGRGLARLAAVAMAFGLVAVTADGASADLPDGVRYDDGFVRFVAVNHHAREQWFLESQVRLLGTGVPRGSAFKFVVKQGRRVLSTTTCEGQLNWRGDSEGAPDRFFVGGCIDRDQPITVAGPLTVDVIFLNDDDGSETVLRTHPLDVRSVTRQRLAGNEAPDHFFINLHAEAAAMLIEQVPMRLRRAGAEAGGRPGSAARSNDVFLNLVRSPEGNIRDTTLRCTVEGERLDLGTDDTARRVGGTGNQPQTVTQVLRVRGQNNVAQEDIGWEWDVIQLPLTFGTGTGAQSNRYVNMDAHPGRWECLLRRSDRRVIRRFAFTVGADGLVLPHPEEEAGLVLHPGAHLADGVIPDDSPIDRRTDPRAARGGAFYGRAWATPQGRAIGAGIPAIGEAYPSTARSRRGRRRRR